MATTSFIADNDKTVTIEGLTYTITPSGIPEGVTIQINGVTLVNGTPVTLTENSTMTVTATSTATNLTVNYSNATSCTFDDGPVTNGQVLNLTGGDHTLEFVGSLTIPNVELNGTGISSFTVNSESHTAEELPYTFQPSGETTSVYIEGQAATNPYITIAGTNIADCTVNNQEVTLPYRTQASEDMTIAVSGEIYQVDLTSLGGAIINQDGAQLTDGTEEFHQILDITKDTYLTVDGQHTLTFSGEDIKSLRINGVTIDVSNLPVTVTDRSMTATIVVTGNEPSEVHIVGSYLDTVTVDGQNYVLGDNGTCDIELQTAESNHFVQIQGSQPREYGITWNDNGTTTITMDNVEMEDGTTSYISKDVLVAATPEPIPVHVEASEDVIVQVNGRDYNSTDFTVDISTATEIDITTDTCIVTVDYGDGSFTITLPQRVIYIAAPHRDGWIFDGWSSNNVGIAEPKSVKTSIDLSGKQSANLVCHYQRFLTWNKPNSWN